MVTFQELWTVSCCVLKSKSLCVCLNKLVLTFPFSHLRTNFRHTATQLWMLIYDSVIIRDFKICTCTFKAGKKILPFWYTGNFFMSLWTNIKGLWVGAFGADKILVNWISSSLSLCNWISCLLCASVSFFYNWTISSYLSSPSLSIFLSSNSLASA